MAELVSVMCATHNGLPYLREAIDSVLGQSYQPVELVVLDDGSDDGTADLVKDYRITHGDRIVYGSQPRAGIGAARNAAMGLAQGGYLTCLDADDRMVPGALARLAAVLDEEPSVGIAFAHVTEFLSPDLEESWRQRLRAPAARLAGRLPTTMLARRSVFEAVGPFAEDYRRGVTLDWTARALESGIRTVLLPEVLFERRLHRTNNGITEAASTSDYVRVVKAALDRRREQREVADVP